MGSGCSSACNTRKNFLPRNVEEHQHYLKLRDETLDETKNKPGRLKCSLTELSSLQQSLIERRNTNSIRKECCKNSRFQGNMNRTRLSPGKSGLIGDSVREVYQTKFLNIRTKENSDLMSPQYSERSWQSTTSCDFRGVDMGSLSADCSDSETAKKALYKIKQLENELSYTADIEDKDMWVKESLKEQDESRDKLSNSTSEPQVVWLPVRKRSTGKPIKNELASAEGRNYCFRESELQLQKQEDCAERIKQEIGFVPSIIPASNLFAKRINMVMVSNPVVSFPTTLGKPRKKNDFPENAVVAYQPRVSYVQTLTKEAPEDSYVKLTVKDTNDIERRSLTNRQPCSKNCEVQQYQSEIRHQKLDISVEKLCEGHDRECKSKGESRGSLTMMSEDAMFAEMDRYLAMTPRADIDFAGFSFPSGEEGSVEKELALILNENSLSVGDVSKGVCLTNSSENDGAVTINNEIELYRSEYPNKKSTPSSEFEYSILDLEKRIFKACEQARRSSMLVDEEMSQNLDNTPVVDKAKLSKPEIEFSKTPKTSKSSLSSSNNVQVKSNIPQDNNAVGVERDYGVPSSSSYVSTPESSSFPEASVLSLSELEVGDSNGYSKTSFVVGTMEEEDDLPLKNTDHDYPTSGQQTSLPEQTPSTPERNRKVQWSFKSTSREFPAVSPTSHETLVSQTNKLDTSRKQLINSFCSINPNWEREHKEDNKLSISLQLKNNVSKWTVQDVQHWLMGLDNEVRHCLEVFKARQIDGERLVVLTPLDFARLIPNILHRYIIMKALEKMCISTNELRWESESGRLMRYQLIELIKFGRFSTTHVARDLEHGNRLCAVKLISSKKSKHLPHPEIAFKEVALKEWLDNSRSMQHQNMIAYYDHSKDATYRGTLYNWVLVREHHQLNLELLVMNGIALGERTSRRILRQIVSLLCFMRSHHIGHFDLQPLNLLVTRGKWEIKLTDWGSFKQFTQKSTHSDGALDPDVRTIYTAPEIYNNREFGLVAESWSLGVILFGLITGTVLFSSSCARDPMYNALKQDSFKVFRKSLKENTSCSLTRIAKSIIFSLVRYNPDLRLDILDVKDSNYYAGIIPSDEKYTSAMRIAFTQFLRH